MRYIMFMKDINYKDKNIKYNINFPQNKFMDIKTHKKNLKMTY